jgi:YD repeat-containing protein
MHFIVVFIVLILGSNVYAQEDQIGQLKKVVPPSPNAAALGKFGDWPVNLYTGTPSISVPLYTLASRDVSVSVSIDYHASGIRVGEIPSWVGSGWSLNAGGVISRSIRGLPDEEPTAGYFYYRAFYSNPENLHSPESSGTWKTHKVGAAKGDADAEQDIYNVNAMGRSYKLLFRGDGTIVTMPFSQLKIAANFSTDTWTVTFEDGTVLTFGNGSGYIEESTTNFGQLMGDLTFTSSWYLKTVVSPLGETISFGYDRIGINSEYSVSQTDYIEYSNTIDVPAGLVFGSCGNVNEASARTSISRQNTSAVLVSTIESDIERLEFIADIAPRQDLEGGRSLHKVRRFSKLLNRYLDEYVFEYSYSQAVNSLAASTTVFADFRLNLARLTKTGTDVVNPQVWDFEYDNQRLPSRTSFAQDHWGYYNGALSNESFLPPLFRYVPVRDQKPVPITIGFFPGMHQLGAKRDTDPEKMKAETLTRITFPTGGTSTFEFEANQRLITDEVLKDTTVYLDMYLSQGLPYSQSKSVNINVAQGQYVYLKLTSEISGNIINDYKRASVNATVTTSNGDEAPTIWNNGQQYFILREPGSHTFTMSTNVTYDLFDSPQHFVDMHASMTYTRSKGTTLMPEYFGGLRVKSITDSDGVSGSPAITRYFVYEDPYIINPINENDYFNELKRQDLNQSNDQRCAYVKMIRSSTTKYSLGSIQGGTVGYGKVTTLYGLNGANGKSESYFSNETDNGMDLSKIFPFVPADNRDWRRGSLLQKLDYTATGDLLKRSSTSYQFEAGPSLTCFKAGFETTWPSILCGDAFGDCGIVQTFYIVSTETVKQTIQREVSYLKHESGQPDSLVKVTTMFYDNPVNIQPTRTESSDSKGRTIKTITRTALEKSDIQNSVSLATDASQAIDLMLSRNMIHIPIETENYLDGQLTAKMITNFKILNTDKVLPADVLLQNGTGPLEKRVEFLLYDGASNLLEQKKSSDISHSYVWSYSGKYPVAEVVNASATQVAFTSFETSDPGGWSFTYNASNGGITGSKCFDLTSGNITKNGISTGIPTKVSFWANSGNVQVNSQAPTAGQTINGWTQYSVLFTGNASVVVSGSAKIDELRLYPASAQMTTSTYDPSIGLTSQTNANNQTTYYEYDEQNRLKLIKDDKGNILKYYKYNYQVR